MKIRPPMLRAICSALLVCSAAHAGMWEDGYADYQRKDYAVRWPNGKSSLTPETATHNRCWA